MLGSEFGNLLWGSIGGVGALSLVLRIQQCVCVRVFGSFEISWV